MSYYNDGTVSLVAGSNVVTGEDTEFLSYVSAGDEFLAEDDASFIAVQSVDSDIQITLVANYSSTRSGITYQITRDFTPHFSLPKINRLDNRSDAIYNRAIQLIDNAMQFGLSWQGSVIDKDLTSPPVAPSDGDAYIVGASATGDWSGYDDYIATYDDTSGVGWVFTAPEERDYVFVDDENVLYLWNGSEWIYWNIVPSGTASYRLAFDNGDLSAGVLTVTHGLGTQYNHVTVYDNSDNIIVPDAVNAIDSLQTSIDISSWGAISGTWNLVITS